MCKFDDLRNDLKEAEKNLDVCIKFNVVPDCWLYKKSVSDLVLANDRMKEFLSNVNSIEEMLGY